MHIWVAYQHWTGNFINFGNVQRRSKGPEWDLKTLHDKVEYYQSYNTHSYGTGSQKNNQRKNWNICWKPKWNSRLPDMDEQCTPNIIRTWWIPAHVKYNEWSQRNENRAKEKNHEFNLVDMNLKYNETYE